MGHRPKAMRQQAMARRQSHKRRRIILSMAVAGLLVAIGALVVLTRPPGYSGFDMIGQQPAIVQVFLPG